VKRTNIYLDEHLDRLLRYLALEQGRSFTDLVREVLLDYTRQQGFPDPERVVPPHRSTNINQHRAVLHQQLKAIHDAVATDMSPNDIEALITEVNEEVKQERIATQLTTHD
jgi:hypothetical protein